VPIETITSPQNPRLKVAASLRETRARRKASKILIDGESIIGHAILGGVRCTELFIRQGSIQASEPAITTWSQQCPNARIAIVAEPAMTQLQYGDRILDVIAVAETPRSDLASFSQTLEQNRSRGRDQSDSMILLVLDGLEKPGNLGAISRTADAAGVTGILLSDPVCEPWNPNAIRSSLGALFRVPIGLGTQAEIREWFLLNKINLFAARVDGAIDYTKTYFPERVGLILGSEALGLGLRWGQAGIASVKIPMRGAIDSLNVSVTASIILFEMVRQRDAAERNA
jgi:TrmH family RNA methyltransferase